MKHASAMNRTSNKNRLKSRDRSSVTGLLQMRSVPVEVLVGAVIDLRLWSLLVTDRTMTKLIAARDFDTISEFNPNGKTVAEMIGNILQTSYWDGKIRRLNVSGAHRLTDVGLNTLKVTCSTLVDLNLSSCLSITDAGIRELVLHTPHLEVLNLSGCGQLEGGCLAAVAEACPRLRSLNASRCTHLQPWAYHKLFSCCHLLETLDVSSTEFTNGEILALTQNVTTLVSLNVTGCPQLSDSGFDLLAARSPNLESLVLVRHTLAFRFTDMSLLAISQGCSILQQLDIAGCEFVTDAGITWMVSGCPHLTDLNLTGCNKLTDASLRAIGQHCRALKMLNVSNVTQMTNIGLREVGIHCLYLQKVVLSGLFLLCEPAPRAKGPKFQKRRRGQEWIHSIESTQLDADVELHLQEAGPAAISGDPPQFTTINGVAALAAHCRSITTLDLSGCFRLNQSFRYSVAKHLKQLQELNIAGCKFVAENSMTTLVEGCRNITTLNVSDCHAGVTNEVMHVIARCLQGLKHLIMQNCTEISDKGIVAIAQCEDLERLDLSGCKCLTDVSLLPICHITHLHNLRVLHLTSLPRVTDTGFAWIADGCVRLELLSLKGTRVSKHVLIANRERFRYSDLVINPNFIGFMPVSRSKDRAAINAYAVFRDALCSLQAKHRAHLQRKRYLEYVHEEKRQEAATKIQCLARQIIASHRVEKQQACWRYKHRCATKIQSTYRMFQGRRAVAAHRADLWRQRREAMAAVIARAWRSYRSRVKQHQLIMMTIQIGRMRTAAAVRVQAVVRGSLAREQTRRLIRHLKAQMQMRNRKAAVIQRVLRGYQQRCWYLAIKDAELRRVRHRQECASRIQKKWRIWKTFQIVKRMQARRAQRTKAASKIQGVARGRITRKRVAIDIFSNRERHMKAAAVAVQKHWRVAIAKKELRQRQQVHRQLLRIQQSAAIVLQKHYRSYCARVLKHQLQELARARVTAFVKVEIASATQIQALWRGTRGRRRATDVYWERKKAWKQLYHEERQQICFFNQRTGQIRWRMPQDMLDLLPKPVCQNCQYYLAAIECADCQEEFCMECHQAVHSGGKRAEHAFRSMYDYYGKRIDYGEGEYPSKWPSDIHQDEVRGWMLRVSPMRQPVNVYGAWEEYYDEDSRRSFYFNRTTFEATYDPALVHLS